jgi:cysteine desulfurase
VLQDFLRSFLKHRIYLDAAAATPLSKKAFSAMEPYLTRHFGNPGSVHEEGRLAKEAVQVARGKVARALSVRPEEITFTSGGTEANNLAILGTIQAHLRAGTSPQSLHVLTTRLEHSSVLKCFDEIKAWGVRIDYIPVDSEGIVDVTALPALLTQETVLVSVHYVNGEIGVVQPLRHIARVVGDVKTAQHISKLVFHTDASQAPLFLDCALEHVGVDMMTLDGQKMYGPKGVGILAHRRTVELKPQILGGGQENKLRSGTEPVPLIVGCAEALHRAQEHRAQNAEKVRTLRNVLHYALGRLIPHFDVNGSLEKRVPNNLNISLPGVDTEFLVVRLDTKGVAVSTRSACEGDSGKSHVVEAMTGDSARAKSTLRCTLPLDITARDIRRAARIIGAEVKILTKRV